jgi:hypothetical protein
VAGFGGLVRGVGEGGGNVAVAVKKTRDDVWGREQWKSAFTQSWRCV